MRKKGELTASKKLIADKAMNIVCDNYGLTPEMIRSSNRARPIVKARVVLSMSLLSLNWELVDIGHVMGGRDHSTVSNHRKSYHNMLFQNARTGEHKETIHLINKVAACIDDKAGAEMLLKLSLVEKRETISKMRASGSNIHAIIGIVYDTRH